jgi:hypothetical protein
MFRTSIKTLSLFRKNSNYNYNYSYSHNAFKKKEQPTLYNDAFNMFIQSAFVKEYTNSKETKYSNNDETELKIICQITGCEKNNKDCSCDKICIVKKSEISMICDLL